MAFKIYRSVDVGAPALYGTTGSILDVLNYCLVTGSGWIKPFNDTGSFPASPTITSSGCWKQPTGSALTLFINDSAPNISSLYREAWATGWENLEGLSSSITNSVGSGSGQFPTPAQLLTTGHVVIRKSTTSDMITARPWIVAADSMSFYLFIATGDAPAGAYYGFAFGDIYSFKSGSIDSHKCIIIGRNAENSSVGANEGMDWINNTLITGSIGHFMARSYTGLGSSITASKHGDSTKGSQTTLIGSLAYPNRSDTALYISPLWVAEPGGGIFSSTIRGQLRGIYQPLHLVSNFTDSQAFSGSLDYNGRTFMAISRSVNGGVYILETSDTLLTN